MYANMYLNSGTIHTKKASAAAPIRMYGLFIADKVNGDDYAYWNYGTFCNSCTPGPALAPETVESTPQLIKQQPVVQSEGNISFMSIKAYPNPFYNRGTPEGLHDGYQDTDRGESI